MNSLSESYIYHSNANLAHLKNIAFEKAQVHPLSELNQVEQLVLQASVRVLQDVTPYLMGRKKIDAKQISSIHHEFDKIKEKVFNVELAREAKLAKKAHHLMSMISRLRKRELDEQNPASLLDDYYQLMGCLVSYGNWKKGEEILGPHPDLPNFKVHDVITNEKGLKIVILVPTKYHKLAAPIFCCRGTVEFEPQNMVDNLNRHIGQYSFPKSRRRILRNLRKVTAQHGPAVITGHSLGGALAQLITAEFCDKVSSTQQPLIKALHYFNAPGVGSTVAKQYKAKRDQLPDDQKPEVVSLYHAGDIVVLAGGAHLEANREKIVGCFSGLTKKKLKEAHSWTQFASEFPNAYKVTHVTGLRKFFKIIGEKIRRIVAYFFHGRRLSHATLNQKIEKAVQECNAFMNLSLRERNRKVQEFRE